MSDKPPVGAALDWRGASRPGRSVLEGRHARVRPLDAAGDAESLFAQSHPPLADRNLWTYLPTGPYGAASEMRSALEQAERSEDPLFFTLVALADERPAGIASYLRITPEHGVIEIGHIWFDASLRRSTAATEVIYLLAAHAFDELGYRRLEWKCNALNQASRRAAERFGFRFEGVFRRHMVIKGRNRDTAWYAITDEEWPAVRHGFRAWLRPENFDAGGRQRRPLGDLIARARG
ncbi:MAG: GNAT family N-acetyltransferase [Solirubrobacterales bacterium]|nr:GNAT family N-acetyltransferase [Solirubrobacterales bacterium]